jgi:hypothetical protein
MLKQVKASAFAVAAAIALSLCVSAGRNRYQGILTTSRVENYIHAEARIADFESFRNLAETLRVRIQEQIHSPREAASLVHPTYGQLCKIRTQLHLSEDGIVQHITAYYGHEHTFLIMSKGAHGAELDARYGPSRFGRLAPVIEIMRADPSQPTDETVIVFKMTPLLHITSWRQLAKLGREVQAMDASDPAKLRSSFDGPHEPGLPPNVISVPFKAPNDKGSSIDLPTRTPPGRVLKLSFRK